MTFSSSLANDRRPLVLDASVLINLHACSYGEQVLTAIANEIVVSDIVARELEHETSKKNGDRSFLHDLTLCGKVTVVGMTDAEYELFGTLSGGSPSLDDGEASTVAIAVHRAFRAVIDERKGRTRAAALMNSEEPGWSLDLLRHPNVVQRLGDELTAEIVYLALRHGRMRIPFRCADEVIALIGRDRALECTCLPNFKRLSREMSSAMPADEQLDIRESRH